MANDVSKITVEKLVGFYQWLSTMYSDIQKMRYYVHCAPDQYFTEGECAFQFKDDIDRGLQHLLDDLNQWRKHHEAALEQEKEDEEEEE